jgi:hypothetical protein
MGKKLPVGVRAGGTAASVPVQTEDSEVIPPPPHQNLHAAATHNPELAHAHTHTHQATSKTSLASTYFPEANELENFETVTINGLEIQAPYVSALIKFPEDYVCMITAYYGISLSNGFGDIYRQVALANIYDSIYIIN